MGCADGILNCDCYGLGVLEVKYPYYMRIKDPDTASCLYEMTTWLVIIHATIKFSVRLCLLYTLC